ncbi:YqeG family HAD IIIA-type phosphatase [Salipaludibacillus daqingensis]|uniref:YqeG family HAD IIIA-type phosphatase n=1 Tax=Salipaludibacillus daqingensis TaxID=3041001 RepID=UPI0024761B47|nr:HAD hydrolase-like protein [Salipaludibacillus daqingensis]
MKYFKPDFELHHFSDITKEWLDNNRITYIFSDLDSTLAIHDKPGDRDLTNWINMLKQQKITLIIASNNSQGRVDRFCSPFQINGFGNCGKPLPHRLRKQMNGTNPNECLFLGDQLLTDIWCGKLLNMKTALVKPIGREHEPLQIKLKRKIEKQMIKRWYK